jgi:hypothetical protein
MLKQNPKPETARRPNPDPKRAVFADHAARGKQFLLRQRELFWKEAFQWSVLAFVLAVGVAMIGWAYWAGQGSRWTQPWFGLRGRPVPPAVSYDEGLAVSAWDADQRRRALDGQPLAADQVDPPSYAVMIDNHIWARPLSGLAEASLVYEVPVEGGITRFMAFYPADEVVERIGPVRSARPYYLDWAAPLEPLYAHVGGSPAALEELRQPGWRDLNEFWNGRYYWRDLSRSAPHNTYTSVGLLGQAWTNKFADEDREAVSSWAYRAEAPVAERPDSVADLVINYSTTPNRATWKYDRERNAYRRYQGNEPHLEEDGSSIWTKNVIVQYHEVAVIDSIGRLRIDTLGEGPAYVATNGQLTAALWQKDTAQDRTRYVTPDGDEIYLNVGSTWVQIVPTGVELSGIEQ